MAEALEEAVRMNIINLVGCAKVINTETIKITINQYLFFLFSLLLLGSSLKNQYAWYGGFIPNLS
jgi:hypothetical protein